jgi:hypothetical protein
MIDDLYCAKVYGREGEKEFRVSLRVSDDRPLPVDCLRIRCALRSAEIDGSEAVLRAGARAMLGSRSRTMTKVLAVVSDLMFKSKLTGTAPQAKASRVPKKRTRSAGCCRVR